MKYEIQEDQAVSSRGQLEIATLGISSWMPYALQGVKRLDDDDYGLFRVNNFV
jgi:hypothetical protein